MKYYNYYFQDRSWVKRVIVNRSVDEEFHEVITKKTFDIKIPDTYPSCEADEFKIILLDFVPKQSLLKFDLTVDGDSSFFITKSEQIEFFYNFICEIWSSRGKSHKGFMPELKEMLDSVCRYRPSSSKSPAQVQEKIDSFFEYFGSSAPDPQIMSNCRQLVSVLLECTPIICKVGKEKGGCIVKYGYSKPLLSDISFCSYIAYAWEFSPVENIETDFLFWDACTNHYYLHYPKDVKVSSDIKVIEKYSESGTTRDYRCESKDNIVFYKIYRNTSGKLRNLNERHGIYFRLFPISLGIRSWTLSIVTLLGILTLSLFLINMAHAGCLNCILEDRLVERLKKIDLLKNNSLPFIVAIGTVIISWFVRVPKNLVSERTRAPHHVILFLVMIVQLMIIFMLVFGINPAGRVSFFLATLTSIIILFRIYIGRGYRKYNKGVDVNKEYNPSKKSYLSSEH